MFDVITVGKCINSIRIYYTRKIRDSNKIRCATVCNIFDWFFSVLNEITNRIYNFLTYVNLVAHYTIVAPLPAL